MKRTYAERASTSLGGGGKVTPSGDNQHVWEHPRHDVDVAIAQSAFAKTRRLLAARNLDAKSSAKQRCFAKDMYRLAKDMCRYLQRNALSVLSSRQRAALERIIGPEEVERIEKMYIDVDNTPEVLRHLPKKPPGR